MQPTNGTNPEMEDVGTAPDTPEVLETTPGGEIVALEERLKTAEQERDEYLNMAQRVQAEFENFRRRNNAARSDAWDDGTRDMIAQMLPVVDNLERALEASDGQGPLCEGVELVYKQMMDVLAKKGVAVINRVGELFDPELENAVMQVDASQGEPGTVATVLQKGYKMGERVIRHAMVQVVAAE